MISELRDSHRIPDLPLTDEADEAVVPGPLEAVCRKLSQHGLVAYLEAEFWGGQGMQAHALFRAGVALGLPVVAEGNQSSVEAVRRAAGPASRRV
jgi:hypothetical protein